LRVSFRRGGNIMAKELASEVEVSIIMEQHEGQEPRTLPGQERMCQKWPKCDGIAAWFAAVGRNRGWRDAAEEDRGRGTQNRPARFQINTILRNSLC